MKASRVPAHSTLTARVSAAVAVLAGIGIFAETAGLVAQQAPANAAACAVTGTITGLGGPLPGVAITVRRGDAVQTATSTGVDGTYKLTLPDNSYQLTAELTGFDHVQKDVTVNKTDACAQTVDLAMTLTPRTASAASAPGRATGPGGRNGGPGARAGAPGEGANRFEALGLQQNAAAANIDFNAIEGNQPQAELTPVGFGSEAVAEAFSVTGDAARVDRGALNDRRDNFNRGEFQLPNFDGRNNEGGFGGGNQPSLAGINQGGGNNGGFNNGGNFNGGGRGRGGDFQLGGRGGRQQRIQYNMNYSFSGSALNAARKQLRSDVPVAEAPYGNHNYGFQAQGPMKIPGILKNTNGSTNISIQFSGRTGTNLFDQYATVPNDAVRNGDFSGVGVTLMDPKTGQPFAGNIIPQDRISDQSKALLQYFPAPNLEGSNTRNYHYSSSYTSRQNSVSFRIQHNFNGQSAGGGGGRGGGGGNNNQQRSNAGLAGKGKRLLGTRTNVNMNLNVQYQQQDQDRLNVFTTLGGSSTSRSYSISPSFNIQRGRAQQQIQIQYNHSNSTAKNHFTEVNNISGLIGIEGVSTDPFAYGLPRLSFASISGLSDMTPNLSKGDRASVSYNFRHPWRRTHQLQFGGDFRYDVTTTHSESTANGNFTFTGIYTTPINPATGQPYPTNTTGFDFADFLLGYPQQATIASGPGKVSLTSKTMGLFFQDEWRIKPSLTAQLGVRYDMLWPFTESHGKMVNLDVVEAPCGAISTEVNCFNAAAPVESGDVGAFTGEFPKGLIENDKNNISPKLGLAWRGPKRFIVRSSYEVNYNNNTYSAIARQLSQQPPFARTGTNLGSISNILLLQDALEGTTNAAVTNNYGIDKNYIFGLVQQGVVNVQRQIGQTWQASAQYTRTRGSNLDIIRAPNRNPDGSLRIDGVQPFSWTSSEGRQVLNSGTFGIEKRASRGMSWNVQYTLARSRDNSPAIGGGGTSSTNIAQNDQDIESEWADSSFIQRHQLSISAQMELPFGPNRRWLVNGGFLAALLENWQFTPNFRAQSGNPYTVTVRNAARDVAQGVSGALRADYDGEPTSIADPTIDRFFNTSAFTVPAVGTYGNSARNIVIGPGSKNFNMNFSRTVRLADNRNLQIRVNVNDLLNMTNYQGIDTNVNSVTFGQVTGISGNRTATINLNYRF